MKMAEVRHISEVIGEIRREWTTKKSQAAPDDKTIVGHKMREAV